PQTSNSRFQEEAGGVFQGRRQTAVHFKEVKCEIEPADREFRCDAGNAKALHADFGLLVIVEHEHEVKERRPAGVAIAGEFGDETVERVNLVFKGFGSGAANAPE